MSVCSSNRFAFNLPTEANHWDEFRAECMDAATWRLLRQTCELVLQKGANEFATKGRAWSVEQLEKAETKPTDK